MVLIPFWCTSSKNVPRQVIAQSDDDEKGINQKCVQCGEMIENTINNYFIFIILVIFYKNRSTTHTVTIQTSLLMFNMNQHKIHLKAECALFM